MSFREHIVNPQNARTQGSFKLPEECKKGICFALSICWLDKVREAYPKISPDDTWGNMTSSNGQIERIAEFQYQYLQRATLDSVRDCINFINEFSQGEQKIVDYRLFGKGHELPSLYEAIQSSINAPRITGTSQDLRYMLITFTLVDTKGEIQGGHAIAAIFDPKTDMLYLMDPNLGAARIKAQDISLLVAELLSAYGNCKSSPLIIIDGDISQVE